ELLESVVARDPDDIEAWQALGTLHAVQGKMEAALQCFQSVLFRRPDRELALHAAARTALQVRRWDLAASLTEQLLRIQPYNPEFYFTLAMANRELGDWSGVSRAAQQGLKWAPFDKTLRGFQGDYASRMGLRSFPDQARILLILNNESRDQFPFPR